MDISKHTTIYDTINVDVFKKKLCKSKRTTRSGFGVNETQPLIGIIGNIRDWKGQSIVIDAVEILKKKFPDLVCLLVGDMSDDCEDFNSGIRDKIIQKGLTQNIIITGFRTDIADIQNALDVFIHASLSPEPYGLVVLEAMVMGTAIVASNEGGPSEMIVDGKSGFLIPPGDPEILADKIDWFLSDVTLRERMGALAQKRFYERFSTFDIKTIETIYLRLLKS